MSENKRGLLCPGGGTASTEFSFSYHLNMIWLQVMVELNKTNIMEEIKSGVE